MSKGSIETFAEIAAPTNPFPGLRPFEFDESHLFFGRDGQSEQLISKLARTRFLAVVGTSGSGKSSLVRAGLLPALLGGFMTSAGSGWRIAIMRPGNDPVGNLAQALNAPDVFGSEIEENAAIQTAIAEATLRRGSLGLVAAVRQAAMPENENLIVVVDQFEEIFRFARVAEGEAYRNEAAAFVKLILEATRQREIPIYVVLTMRSDYLGDCSQFWELPEAINESQYLIPRLTRDQLREAITGPVAVGGGRIAPRLVNRLLNDVGDDQDQLPILQHALMRTWDQWKEDHHDDEPVDLDRYEAIGTMSSALSNHADEAYAELPGERSKEIAEKILKGLTEKGSDNREVRRPIELKELCALAEASEVEVVAVIEVFRKEGRSFLMPPAGVALTGAALIDISHESLIRNWKRLKEWVEQETRSARIYRRLAETAALHSEGAEALLIDPALQVALDWRETNRPNTAWARRYHPAFETAMAFLDQSAVARDAEMQERERQRKREASYKRSRWTAIILGLAFILSLASLTFAYTRLSQAKAALSQAEVTLEEANRARAIANDAAHKAKNQQLAAEKQAALAKQQSADATTALHFASMKKEEAERAKAQADMETRRAVEAQRQSLHLLYAADINLAQQAYESGNVERASDLLKAHASENDPLGDPRGFEWYYLQHLLHSVKQTLKAPDTGFISVITSPDGNTLAVGAGAKVELRGIGSDETKSIPLPKGFSIGSLAISPDGKVLAVGDAHGGEKANVILYDTKSLKELGPLKDGSDSANCVVFTPDGKKLIVGGGEGSVTLWDVNSSRKLDTISLEGTINLAISPDGKTLAIGSANSEMKRGTVLLWNASSKGNVAEGKVAELVGHGDSVTAAAFSPDGQTLATGSTDKTVRLWDVEQRRTRSVLSFASRVFSLAFSPDGHFLAIGYEDGSIKLCETKEYQACTTLRGHLEAVISLAFSAGGKLLFSSDAKFKPDNRDAIRFEESGRTRVKSWDVVTLTREQTAVAEADKLEGIAEVVFSNDGKTCAVLGNHQTKISFFDAETNKLERTLDGYGIRFQSIAFSPDDRLFATAEDNRTVRIWNASDGKQIGEPLRQDELVFALVFSPDGKLLATSEHNGGVKIWATASWKLISKLKGDDNRPARDVCFLPDGRSLALHRDANVEFWDWKLEKQLHQIKIQTSKIGFGDSFALSPDGRVFAHGHDDGRVVLYDAATGKKLAALKYQDYNAPAIAFSPDSRAFVIGSNDGTLKLWDTGSLRELLTLKGDPILIMSAVFSSDASKLAVVDYYNRLRVWRAPRDAVDPGVGKAPSDGPLKQ